MRRYWVGEIDDDTLLMANRIAGTVPHLESINLSRLYFLYSVDPAKVGNTFALGSVLQPSALENSINPAYDFIIAI